MANAKRKAFTLVELLVVISIIALLLAILMPSLNKARESAKKVVCLSNMRSCGLGFNLYANDYKVFPMVNSITWFGPINYWQGQIAPYLGGAAASKYTYAPGNWTGDNSNYPDRQLGVFRCPTSFKVPSSDSWFGNSYGINRYLWIDAPPSAYFRSDKLKSPQTTFLIMDNHYYLVYDGITASFGASHDRGKSVLYSDLHVESGYRELDKYWDERRLWGDTYFAWLVTR
jgi:prepilin-type N-terminal cleavage/methylation domain-containing protein